MKMKKERDFNGQVMETGLECTGLDWTGLSTHINMGFVDLMFFPGNCTEVLAY